MFIFFPTQAINPCLELVIVNSVISTVTTVIANFQARYSEHMLCLCKKPKKSFYLNTFHILSISAVNSKAFVNALTSIKNIIKASIQK